MMKKPLLSVVIPCYNEEKTIGKCIIDAKQTCEVNKIPYEIIVVDNNSQDESAKISKKEGAKVVSEKKQGYGHAYHKGFSSAKGEYIFIADGDYTYDFKEIPKFYSQIEKGYEFVIGNRFTKKMESGAMPRLHKYIGNPFLSGLINILFHNNIKDTQCGARLIKKTTYEKLKLQSKGMEFASEMIIKATKQKIKIKQIKISYKTRLGESKLSSFSDGWRHLRFILMMNPTATYIIPGIILSILGILIFGILFGGPKNIAGLTFYEHPLFLASILLISGTQLLFTGYFVKTLSISYFKEKSNLINKIQNKITLEKGMFIGTILLLTSIIWGLTILSNWIEKGFSELHEVRTGILLLTLATISVQIIINSFYFYTIKAINEEQL